MPGGICAALVRPDAVPVGAARAPCLPAQLSHRLTLSDEDRRLLLYILQRGILHIDLLDIQHLAGDVAPDGRAAGAVGIQTGAHPVVPIGIQHPRAGDIGVAQRPPPQNIQSQSAAGGQEIIRQRSGHGLCLLGRGQGLAFLPPTQCLSVAPDLLLHRQSVGHPFGGKLYRRGGGADHRHFVFADAADDVVAHQRTTVAAVDALPLVAGIEPLIDAVLLKHPMGAQTAFVGDARLKLAKDLLREQSRRRLGLRSAVCFLHHVILPSRRQGRTLPPRLL